jgi:hypothetical protein
VLGLRHLVAPSATTQHRDGNAAASGACVSSGIIPMSTAAVSLPVTTNEHAKTKREAVRYNRLRQAFSSPPATATDHWGAVAVVLCACRASLSPRSWTLPDRSPLPTDDVHVRMGEWQERPGHDANKGMRYAASLKQRYRRDSGPERAAPVAGQSRLRSLYHIDQGKQVGGILLGEP